VEKDVTAAAVAELWMGDADDRGNFAFFYYGTGTGMGVVLNGEVIRGASGNAGDIGHILVTDDGALCSCGVRRGRRCGYVRRHEPRDVPHVDFA